VRETYAGHKPGGGRRDCVETVTVKQLAELTGVTRQAIIAKIDNGSVTAELVAGKNGRKQYLIPVSSLDARLQKKYYKTFKPDLVLPQKEFKPLDSYSEPERRQIEHWADLIKKWQVYRTFGNTRGELGAKDTEFIEKYQLKISKQTLYRKKTCLDTGDYDGLIDKRGSHLKGKSRVDNKLFDIFAYFYLDDRKYSDKKCTEYAYLWAQQNAPELLEKFPSVQSFRRRRKKELTFGVEMLARHGEKAFYDRCEPYIRRTYEELDSNDFWIGDVHTADVITMGAGGIAHRLYLTAFMDARSGILTGYAIGSSPSGDTTLLSLRKGILKHGIPRKVYVDNGREYLNRDIG